MKNIAKRMVVATGVMLLAYAGAATAGNGVAISPRPDSPELRVQRTHRAVPFQRSTRPANPVKGVQIQLNDEDGAGGTLLGINPGATALDLTRQSTQLLGGWAGWVCEVTERTSLEGFVEIAVRCP